MYCKFCGTMLDNDGAKCLNCGAAIDLNDGGQSFFEDDELEAWRTPGSALPRTAVLDDEEQEAGFPDEPVPAPKKPPLKSGGSPEAKNILFKQQSERADFLKPSAAAASGERQEIRHRDTKSKGKHFEILDKNLGIIIGCIVAFVAVVIAAAIAVSYGISKKDVDGGGEQQEQTDTQNEQSQQQGGGQTPQQILAQQDAAIELPEGVKYIGDLPPDICEERSEITVYDASQNPLGQYKAYIINGVYYYPAGVLLNCLGYKYDEYLSQKGVSRGIADVVCQNGNGMEIWLKTGENQVEIHEEKKELSAKVLRDGTSAHPGGKIYVPAVSFLKNMGYADAGADEKSIRFVLTAD